MDALVHPMFITRMRKILILVLLCLLCSFAGAQSASPNLNPDQANQPEKTPPEISFTLNFPAASPPFYNIAIDSTGRADFLLNGYLMGWSNSGYSEATNIYIDDFKLYDTNPGW